MFYFIFILYFVCCFRPQKISSSATRSIGFTSLSVVVMALVMMLLRWNVIWGFVFRVLLIWNKSMMMILLLYVSTVLLFGGCWIDFSDMFFIFVFLDSICCFILFPGFDYSRRRPKKKNYSFKCWIWAIFFKQIQYMFSNFITQTNN